MSNTPHLKSNSPLTRRNLLRFLSTGAIGGTLLPHLSAQRPPGRGPKLPADEPPEKIWDVQAPQKSAPGQGNAVFLNGQIVYTSGLLGGALILQDVQTGQTNFTSPDYLGVSNAVAVGGKIYFIAARLGRGAQLMCHDMASTDPPSVIYSTHIFGQLSAQGRYLYFVEQKGNSNYAACWDTSANAMVWSVDCQNSVDASSQPSVTSGAVIYGFIDRLVAIDPATQKILWTFDHPINSNNALYNLALGDGNVYCTCNNTLYGVDLTTGKGWQWSGTSALSDPAVYNGVVFVGDTAGKLNGIQGSADGAVAPGNAAWPALPLGGIVTGPTIIEDGIAYCANNFLVAVDLTAAQPKSVTYTAAGPVTMLNGVENGVAYFSYNGGSRSAAVDIGQQLHEFFCESQLMADDYVASSTQPSGYQPANPCYRTHVRLLDTDSNPRVNKSVKVWASDAVTITSSGTTYALGPGSAAWLMTDNSGELEIIAAAQDISTPALYLWGTFMDQQEAIVIYPDHSALTKLSAAPDSDWSQGKTFDGNDLLTNPGGSSALASTVRNTLGGVAQSLALTRTQRAGRHRRGRRRATTPPGGIADTSTYIAFPHSTPNIVYQSTAGNADRVYVQSNTPNWSTVINADGTLSYQPGMTRLNLQDVLTLDFATFVQNVARGASKVAKVVVNTADAVYHTITDDLGRIYRFAVDTVEKAIAVVSSILKTVLKDIVKAVEWLSWLFNWDDFLATKDLMKAELTANVGKLKTWLQTQQGSYAGVHQTMKLLSGANGIDNANTAIPGKTFQSVQVDNNDPQATYGANGAQSYTPSMSLRSKVTQNAGQGTVTDSTLLSSGDPGNIVAAGEVFIKTVESKLATDFKTLWGDLERMGANFKLLIANPNKFVENGIADVTQLAKDVEKTLLDFIDAVVEGFITMLAQILDDILDMANATIHIPVISELWQLISHSPLTVLDLCALLTAVPVTLVEKAIHGVNAALPGTPPPLNQNIAFAFAGSFSAIFDGLTDLLDFPDTGMEARIAFGLSILAQGFNFPDNEIGNPDGNQLLLYAVSWLPVAQAAFLFAAQKANPVLKQKVSDVSSEINFTYGTLTLVLSCAIGAVDPAYAGTDYFGMISGILSSVPYMAKFAATGPGLSPPRIAVSVIDGVFEATSLGFSLA